MTEPDPFWDAPCGTPVDWTKTDPEAFVNDVATVIALLAAIVQGEPE